MHIHFDYILQRSASRFEDRSDVINGLLGLSLNILPYQLSTDWIDGTCSGHKNEISGSPALRIGALGRRPAF